MLTFGSLSSATLPSADTDAYGSAAYHNLRVFWAVLPVELNPLVATADSKPSGPVSPGDRSRRDVRRQEGEVKAEESDPQPDHRLIIR
jgi:hypothetical protein